MVGHCRVDYEQWIVDSACGYGIHSCQSDGHKCRIVNLCSFGKRHRKSFSGSGIRRCEHHTRQCIGGIEWFSSIQCNGYGFDEYCGDMESGIWKHQCLWVVYGACERNGHRYRD